MVVVAVIENQVIGDGTKCMDLCNGPRSAGAALDIVVSLSEVASLAFSSSLPHPSSIREKSQSLDASDLGQCS